MCKYWIHPYETYRLSLSDMGMTACLLTDVSLKLPPCSKTFQEAQTDLNHTAAELNHSAGEVVHSSRGTSGQLAAASRKFSQDFDEFLDAGIEMAGHTQVGSIVLPPLHL